ncbi:MAG: hypothetical protein GF355_16745 [Candidatus Eisenbacteria bacterium]|nr:hypothetical protein [Candidatus Eisenbacteria bacterium]
MTRWKIEFASGINTGFLRDLFQMEDIIEEVKRRTLRNIASAQDSGEIRSDIDPEFLWLVMEKLNELVKEGAWKRVFNEFSQFQEQYRTLLFYGLLARKEQR